MGKRILNLSALILVLAAMGMVAAAGDIVYPATDELLGKYETGNMSFEKLEIGDLVVYYHQRTINDAIVEGDFISYQFARNTGELVKKREHWRTDVPDHVTPAITLAQAESMVDGTVQSARLYIISPESEIYHLDPPPVNPCWIVTSVEDGKTTVSIIDAIDGTFLGYGTSPPPGVAPGGNDSTGVSQPATSVPPTLPSAGVPSATPVPAASPAGGEETGEEIAGFTILPALASLLAMVLLRGRT